MMFIRVMLAAVVLIGYAKLSKIPLQVKQHWRKFLVLGAVSSAIPFVLIGFAELTITGSMAAILNSTTPLFTTFVAAIALGERLTPYKIIGAIMGIVGVSLIVGDSPVEMDGAFVLAMLASLGAALCYAIGGVYAKRAFAGVSNMTLSTGQLVGATAVLMPFSVVSVPNHAVPAVAIVAVLMLAVFATAFAYRLYYYLIISAGPTKALTVTLLVPVFGVIWGGLFLKETISEGMILGMIIILLSVGLVTGMLQPRLPFAKPKV
jgi:drug/metabolite transporter (DMT)-like permease